MSQDALADALGITQQSVSKWEAGQSTPGKRRLAQVAQLLDITVGDLLAIDNVVITHPDVDHTQGLVELVASGVDLGQLEELDPEGYEQVIGLARTLLDRAQQRREQP